MATRISMRGDFLRDIPDHPSAAGLMGAFLTVFGQGLHVEFQHPVLADDLFRLLPGDGLVAEGAVVAGVNALFPFSGRQIHPQPGVGFRLGSRIFQIHFWKTATLRNIFWNS